MLKFALISVNVFYLLISIPSKGNFYLIFFILTNALTSDTLNPKPFPTNVANVLHQVLNYIYIILIVCQVSYYYHENRQIGRQF
jgi:chitin synthase